MDNIKCINTDCPNFSSEHRWNCSTYKDCCKFIPEQDNIKCINTYCPNFSSEHRWNCYINLSEERIKNCFNYISEDNIIPKKNTTIRKEKTNECINTMCNYHDITKPDHCHMTPAIHCSNYKTKDNASNCLQNTKEDNMYCKQISCVKKDCIYILDEDYNFRTESKYDYKGCIHYKKKEYKCNTTTCIHYSMELNGCDLTYVPLKTLGVCSAYVTEPIKESTCSHCGESLESETSLIIARRFRSSLKYMYGEKFKSIDKMAENYEEAIIDAVEDEQRRIVRLIIDLNTPADTSYTKWSEIKNIIIPIIQGEIK